VVTKTQPSTKKPPQIQFPKNEGGSRLKKELQATLETPCIVIDVRTAKHNIEKMQVASNACSVKLRPHIKTHKMPYFAKMQVGAGCAGITCAKVREAEVMADAGIQDIFIAYPMVGPARVNRVIALAQRIQRLILGVDSIEMARPLSEAAMHAGIKLEVQMEVDTGAKRTGVMRGNAAHLAQELAALPGLHLTGIYTFKSLVFNDQPTLDKVQAGAEEGELMAGIAADIRGCGISIEDISAGSTPTGIEVAKTGEVTEIRPGTYIFNDFMLVREGVASLEDIAVRIYATVVSTPCREYAVIDGGTKTFPMDITPETPPFQYPGYAVVADSDDLQLLRMNEEHGILSSKKGDTGLHVGDIVELIPVHVCTAINMHNSVYLYDGIHLRREVVAARGMLL